MTAATIAAGPFAGRCRALVLGIGGGGDVVGALALAREIESAGGEAELGGVAWERHSIDPHHAGPRPLDHLAGIERLGSSDAAVCGPEGRTPEGAPPRGGGRGGVPLLGSLSTKYRTE